MLFVVSKYVIIKNKYYENSTINAGNSEEHEGNSNERNEYAHQFNTRVYTVPLNYGLGYDYPYYGYPYYGNPYYGYPFGYRIPHNRNRVMPYQLSLQIQTIKMDYKNKLREARHDKSLSHLQRIQKIVSLKTERDQSIINAQRDFVRQGSRSNKNPEMNNNQNQDNSHASS
jgi:hypothetical protein